MTDKLDSQAFDLIEGGQKIDLFQPVDASATSTSVDKASTFHKSKTYATNSEIIHNSLMVAGLSPGYGIIADAADVILYSAEGEFGEAIWSAGAALPFVGQYIAAQRMLFKAKKSGEKIHKLYRGVDQWYPGRMVQDGMHVSEGTRVGPHFSDPSRKLLMTLILLVMIR